MLLVRRLQRKPDPYFLIFHQPHPHFHSFTSTHFPVLEISQRQSTTRVFWSRPRLIVPPHLSGTAGHDLLSHPGQQASCINVQKTLDTEESSHLLSLKTLPTSLLFQNRELTEATLCTCKTTWIFLWRLWKVLSYPPSYAQRLFVPSSKVG